MELASGLASGGDAAVFMAAEAHGHAPVVRNQLAANHRIPDLRADGLGHLGVARATLGADAALELGLGATALGAQPNPYDLLRPRPAPLALRMEEAERRFQVRPARACQECARLPLERSILGQCNLRALIWRDHLDVL